MITAGLDRLIDPELRRKRERYESFRDGGGGMVLREDVILRQASLSLREGVLVVQAESDGALFEASCRALDLPEDWRPYASLELELEAGDQRILAEVSVLGARNRIPEEIWIDAGERRSLRIGLDDLPLAAGSRPPYHPTGLRLKIRWGETWPSEGAWLRAGGAWPATAANPPTGVRIHSLRLHARTQGEPPPVVDGFGQRLRGRWATRVEDAAHFAALRDEEAQWLARTAPPADRDRFGGWTAGPQLAASGFFRVEQLAGRWWYVDPDGRPFWSVGTTGVRVSDTTLLEGREALFAALPDPQGPLGDCYRPPIGSPANDGRGKRVISFYLLNVLRKYGSLEAWRERVIARFRAVGYNTIGNWSDPLMLDQQALPHTRALSSRVLPSRIGNGHMPDVFDPAWRPALDAAFAREVAPQRGNPWLLGWFVDNELPWHGLARHPFAADAAAPVRAELARFAQRHHRGDLAAAGRDFGRDFGAWSELAALRVDELPAQDPPLLVAFAGHYAETYFATVVELLKRHDPDHLYLGCRFVRRRPGDAICAAAGRHCDVVTVNCYSLLPEREEFGAWHHSTGRPIQIGEHHLPLRSERQLPPLYPAFTAEERRDCYEAFLRCWAGQPWSLGAHWFQHADQNATGRPLDGENQTVGFVDITDRPHPELVAAAMAATRQCYAWHAEAEA